MKKASSWACTPAVTRSSSCLRIAGSMAVLCSSPPVAVGGPGLGVAASGNIPDNRTVSVSGVVGSPGVVNGEGSDGDMSQAEPNEKFGRLKPLGPWVESSGWLEPWVALLLAVSVSRSSCCPSGCVGVGLAAVSKVCEELSVTWMLLAGLNRFITIAGWMWCSLVSWLAAAGVWEVYSNGSCFTRIRCLVPVGFEVLTNLSGSGVVLSGSGDCVVEVPTVVVFQVEGEYLGWESCGPSLVGFSVEVGGRDLCWSVARSGLRNASSPFR